jgi:hypothetical protein
LICYFIENEIFTNNLHIVYNIYNWKNSIYISFFHTNKDYLQIYHPKIIQNITQSIKEISKNIRIKFSNTINLPFSLQIKILKKEYPVLIQKEDLDDFINECQGNAPEYFEKVNSVIQAVTTIRKKDARSYVVKPDSRGAKLKNLEDSIANLDETQSKAVLETTKGVQRIRGLAGSGKTIVLALKVAYLHATHPDWNIAVTFYTRSLKDQYKDLITRFSYEHKNSEPDWEKVKIIHAWGSPKIEGIYYELCKRHNIEYLDFSQARNLTYLLNEDPFEFVCQKALREIKKFHQYYDLILIDEAQDLNYAQYNIIKAICGDNHKNVLMVGDPGVGKTAIIEGLAQEVAKNNVPEFLKNHEVWSLEIGA